MIYRTRHLDPTDSLADVRWPVTASCDFGALLSYCDMMTTAYTNSQQKPSTLLLLYMRRVAILLSSQANTTSRFQITSISLEANKTLFCVLKNATNPPPMPLTLYISSMACTIKNRIHKSSGDQHLTREPVVNCVQNGRITCVTFFWSLLFKLTPRKIWNVLIHMKSG